MKSLSELQNDVHYRLLELRSLERLVSGYEFGAAYAAACEPCRHQAEELIAQSNGDGLSRWIVEQRKDDYLGQTIRELRKVAQRLGVPHYSVLPKASLLSEIARYEKATSTIDGTGAFAAQPHHFACQVA